MPLDLCEPKLGLSPLAARLRIAGFFEVGAKDAGGPSAARGAQLVEEARPFLTNLDDSLPLPGPVRGAAGLVVATGHGMLGVTLAPVTGLAVAAIVRGESPAWIAPFAPGRRAR